MLSKAKQRKIKNWLIGFAIGTALTKIILPRVGVNVDGMIDNLTARFRG